MQKINPSLSSTLAKDVKFFGTLIIIVGIGLGLFALMMNTSVEVDYPMGNMFGLPTRVNNLGLMSDKQNYLILSGVLLLLGTIMVIFKKPQSQKPEQKRCPQCAENVKSEAVICRYCNYKFSPEKP